MKPMFDEKRNVNPLSDLIPDDIYQKLSSRGFINEKSVRDHLIRKKFAELKAKNMSAAEAIELIREEYPYLQYDTIRKIVYQSHKKV
ncbi:MAG: hypothetical protein N2249_05550 [Melioribacter sp.]|nr:hypothetical protein [Melioribacter sp.]